MFDFKYFLESIGKFLFGLGIATVIVMGTTGTTAICTLNAFLMTLITKNTTTTNKLH